MCCTSFKNNNRFGDNMAEYKTSKKVQKTMKKFRAVLAVANGTR